MPVYPDISVEPGEPGDQMVDLYSYEYRNLLFGSGTDFITKEVEGLLGAEATAEDTPKENDHGAVPGPVLMGTRTIEFDMTIRGARGSDIENKISVFRKTFQVPRKRYWHILDPFVFWRPGGPKKMIMVRCTARNIPSNYKTASGLAECSVQLEAPDPLIYSLEQFSQNVVIAQDSTSRQTTIVQEGDYVDGSYPILTFQGPATNPVITNNTDDNRQIRLNGSIGSLDTVQINVKSRKIYLNGVLTQQLRSSDNQWWALLPGENEIVYSRASGNTSLASTLTVEWRSTYQ